MWSPNCLVKYTRMKCNFFFFVVLLTLSYSCTNTSSNQSKIFDQNQWKKSNPQTFIFNQTEDSKPCTIVFSFSHVYEYQFDSVPLIFTLTKADGSAEIKKIDLQLKDKNGKDLGDCAGDICDLNTVIFENISLPKGENTLKVAHTFHFDYLPNVLQIGVNCTPSK